MKCRAVASLLCLLPLAAAAADAKPLPAVKAGTANQVAACVTPGRLMAFVAARNGRLDERFDSVATEYMRHGEELGVRWDYAFFQMLYETGNLGFGGDVRPAQNNFAGLGATGRGERGESFPTISAGVKAHLQHLLMYAGDVIEAPVAERTRKVQQWGVLTAWHKSIAGPVTYADLARKWAPGVRGYTSDIETIADAFFGDFCNRPDPRPQLVAEARRGRGEAVAQAAAPPAVRPGASEAVAPKPPSGSELARKAVEQARVEGNAERSGLGAGDLGRKEAPPVSAAGGAALPRAQAMTADPPPQPPAARSDGGAGGADKGQVQTAMAGTAAKAAPPAAAAAAKCRVWTASYGGQKAVIIRAQSGHLVNYTVLDVNEGSEKREAEAYIAAYAKGGQQVAEFPNQSLALDKAFELCPES